MALLGCAGLLACTREPASAQDAGVQQAAPAPANPQSVAEAMPAAPMPPVVPSAPAAAMPVAGTAMPELRGRTLPPYPDGLEEVQSDCIAGGPEYERVCDFALGVLGRKAGEDTPATQDILIASRAKDAKAATPAWWVMDARKLPAAQEGYELQMGNCRLDGADDLAVVAAARVDEQGEYFKDIAWAVRFDTAAGALVDIDHARVDCINTALGL